MSVDAYKRNTCSESMEDDVFDDEQPLVLKDVIPALENGWGSYGDFQLVGNGEVTNEYCGRYSHSKGCLRVENHNKVVFDKFGNSVNCSGKGYIKIFHNFCYKPSCPVCYKYGWAVREAKNIGARLSENGKYSMGFGRWGMIEHIVASVPVKDYYLSFEAMRLRATKILFNRGVIGGVLIFHGFRFNPSSRDWYWSPHFHVLGFILGGYARCRYCKRKWNCLKGCGGFDDRNYHDGFLKDGWVVKVLGKRKTVVGTAWYQLHHATYKVNSKRFHVATWWGVCSYRKLKVTVVKRKHLCPICHEELYKVYVFLAMVRDRDSPDYVPEVFVDVYASDGSPNCAEAVSGSSG